MAQSGQFLLQKPSEQSWMKIKADGNKVHSEGKDYAVYYSLISLHDFAYDTPVSLQYRLYNVESTSALRQGCIKIYAQLLRISGGPIQRRPQDRCQSLL